MDSFRPSRALGLSISELVAGLRGLGGLGLELALRRGSDLLSPPAVNAPETAGGIVARELQLWSATVGRSLEGPCAGLPSSAAHRLLGQPHSFEGFVLLAVLAAFGDLAAA